MLRAVVEKFYALLFADEEQTDPVPYGNKLFMFFFSLVAFLVIVIIISLDIAENISKNL